MERTAEQRFWAKVQKTETCWLWQGTKDRNGYGQKRAELLSYQRFRALQVAVHLDGRQAEGLTGPFGHQLTV
jgi:hypothetical protein